jgi:hypothetical protein
MSDSNTRHDTILPPTPTGTSTGIDTGEAPAPKRNHNRRPGSTCKGRLPLTTAQKQEAVVLAAAGYAPSRVAKTMGKSRLMVKRHLEAPETIVKVEDERAEMVQLCRDKARACVVGIDDEKISKANVLQLSTSAGILIDKAALMSGQPTSIHVHALVDVLDAISELRERRNEEDEREYRAARALLSLPANQT